MQRQLKLLQGRFKRNVKGSSNWKNLPHKIARLHECIANTGKHFHLKVAHQICDVGSGKVLVNRLLGRGAHGQ